MVAGVLARWWRLRIPNTYKEAAWRLALGTFPTARRMDLTAATCVACGAVCPDVGHHFWSCPVAVVVRQEVAAQLVAAGLMPAPAQLSCTSLWMGVSPLDAVLPWVWDLVCVAAVHAMEVGRAAAWATSRHAVQDVVLNVAGRAALAAFWSALADFAATAPIPRRLRSFQLTQQPFIAWHAVVVRGSGLRVVRR